MPHSHNVSFEAPNWQKKYMLSLKPIGLCTLLCGNAGVDSTDSLEIVGDDMNANLGLLRIILVGQRYGGSAYAIGFNDADLQIYRRRSRIHVIAPSMEKEEEDRLIRPHRWITTIPQLRTHMSTIVVEDLRSKPVAQQELDKSNHNSNKRSRKSIKSKLQKNALQPTGQLHLMSCGRSSCVGTLQAVLARWFWCYMAIKKER